MAASEWAGLACLQLINTLLLQQQTGVGLLSVVILWLGVRLLDPKNGGLAVGTASLSGLEAEI